MSPFKVSCLLDGKPHSGPLPEDVRYVGMEQEPNATPRYGTLQHSWFNRPCYETLTEDKS